MYIDVAAAPSYRGHNHPKDDGCAGTGQRIGGTTHIHINHECVAPYKNLYQCDTIQSLDILRRSCVRVILPTYVPLTIKYLSIYPCDYLFLSDVRRVPDRIDQLSVELFEVQNFFS